MTWYLLDSDAVIDIFRAFPSTVGLVNTLVSQGDTLCTCSIVVAELYAGFYPIERGRGESLLGAMVFLSASSGTSRQAGLWRYAFARRGRQLPTTDCLIAAIALEHGATLLTGNVKDFPMEEVRLMPLPRARVNPE